MCLGATKQVSGFSITVHVDKIPSNKGWLYKNCKKKTINNNTFKNIKIHYNVYKLVEVNVMFYIVCLVLARYLFLYHTLLHRV